MPVVEGGAKPVPIDLNERFRFDKAGAYRLFLTGRTSTTPYGFADDEDSSAPVITSNTVEFQVLPPDRGRSAQELGRAIGWMEAKSQKTYDGCRAVRFLDTQAASEMIKRYSSDPFCEGQLRLGLFGFPDREFAVRKMRAQLTAPDQAVSEDCLQMLAKLSVYLLHPDANSTQTLGGNLALGGGSPESYERVQAEERRDLWIRVDALGKKAGQPRAISFKNDLRFAFRRRRNAASGRRQRSSASGSRSLPQPFSTCLKRTRT
jgi:hypothetical protein